MGSVLDDGEQVHVLTVEEWRAWLAANHERVAGVWFVRWRSSASRAGVPYPEAVEEALCVGWIDGPTRTLDDERSVIWFSPRRAGSGWAASNRERADRLEREGRMTDAGRAAIERAKADGSWSILESVERLELPEELVAALAARPPSREVWDAAPPSSRRLALQGIVFAKRAETKAKRITAIVERCAAGQRPA
ncbi:MAG TPA: YdeI/OmpD-associated family protein [Acidimicrobiales bacterium]